MNTKQVIVIRKDLNMRKGKMCAQASHASMSFLTRELTRTHWFDSVNPRFLTGNVSLTEAEQIDHWLKNSFRKIVCYVNSKEELYEVYSAAKDKGLMAHMIIDNGATEFNGVKTATCIAIGPHWDNKFEGVSDHLPLL